MEEERRRESMFFTRRDRFSLSHTLSLSHTVSLPLSLPLSLSFSLSLTHTHTHSFWCEGEEVLEDWMEEERRRESMFFTRRDQCGPQPSRVAQLRTSRCRPLSSEYGTCKTVKPRFWP